MRYAITHTTSYGYSEVVPVCHNEVFLTPRDEGRQTCRSYRLIVTPAPDALVGRRDYFGNQAHHFAIQQGHRSLTVTATSRVEIRPGPRPDPAASPAWEAIRDRLANVAASGDLDAAQFVFDSPHVERVESLADYARPSFPPGRPLLDAALDLAARIHSDFQFVPGATAIHTRAEEVLSLRRGVCQDFAHLQIGCLRSLGLAARYVSGYLRTIPPPGQPRLVGVDASHAWLSVYCGEPTGWVDLDPTNNVLPDVDHITLAWGRDYSDVCPIKGVYIGGGAHDMTVSVDVEPLDGAA